KNQEMKGVAFLFFSIASVVGMSTRSWTGDLTAGVSQSTQVQVHTFTRHFANVYFLERDGRYLMIDSGLPGDCQKLLAFMDAQQIDPRLIEGLILTHAHPDHAGNAAYFQQTFGTPIIAGAGDTTIIRKGGVDESLYPRGFQAKIIQHTIANQVYPSFIPDTLIERYTKLLLPGWSVRVDVFHSHTPGSLVIYVENMVFVGDLLKGKTLHSQKPTWHIFMCDLAANLSDLSIVAAQENFHTWYAVHLGPLSREDVLTFINKQKKKYE
ncbi:MAG: MBL fold metallo-hydrolase, partial [Bacteroidota bacterium]